MIINNLQRGKKKFLGCFTQSKKHRKVGFKSITIESLILASDNLTIRIRQLNNSHQTT